MKKLFLLLFIILISSFCFSQVTLSACASQTSFIDTQVTFNGTIANLALGVDWTTKQRNNFIFNVKPSSYTIVNLFINNRDSNNVHAPFVCVAETSNSNVSGFNGSNFSSWDVTSQNFGYGNCNSNITATMQVCSFIVRNAAQVTLQFRSDGCTVACNGTYDLVLDVGASATAISSLLYDNTANLFKSATYDPCSNSIGKNAQGGSVNANNRALTVNAGTTTDIGISPSGNGFIFICEFEIGISANGSYQFVEGTKTTNDCDTGQTAISPPISLNTGNVVVQGVGNTTIFQTNTANDSICMKAVTGNVQLHIRGIRE